MNSKSMGISDLKNGGDLIKLPREVRDEIYRYLVKGNYVIEIIEASLVFSVDPGYYPHTAILASSKAISHEAAVVMFGESNFETHLYLNEVHRPSPLKRPLGPYSARVTEVCNRLMNLEFHIYGLEGSAISLWPQYRDRMEDFCATIELFTGTDVLRNRLRIIIYWAVDVKNTLTSPFFETLKRLRGFRTIRLQLESMLPFLGKSDPQLLFEQMEKDLQAIEAYLEPALGHGDHSFSCVSRTNGPDRGCLTFHPNEHTIKTSG